MNFRQNRETEKVFRVFELPRLGAAVESSVQAAQQFVPLRIHYEAFALLPRHSFAERKRMQGQKPLWSPGAWQEYFSAAWLEARCPHVHISRACSGVARTPRPRTATTVFPFSDFMLFTVPRSLYTPWGSFQHWGSSPSLASGWQIAKHPAQRTLDFRAVH